MSFRNIESPDDAAAYVAGLNERWPSRPAVVAEIEIQIRKRSSSTLSVLELCCGGGLLGEHLLSQLSALRYVGIDLSPHLLAHARENLKPFAERAKLLEADLNQNDWVMQLSTAAKTSAFDAVVSMQSLHDLGGEDEVNRIYGIASSLLRPGGLFINADLVVQPGEELADNPGRRSVARHLALLRSHGYRQVKCSLEQGGFGVLIGIK